jgi:small subunit ribosomal protein S6
MRNYELMVILDPNLDERTVAPSLDTFLRVITGDGGTVEKVDIWGKRRMAYEIAKNAEGIYAVLDVVCEPDTVKELDRQLSLNESVLRTKVMRREANRRSTGAPGAGSKGAAAVAAAGSPRPSAASAASAVASAPSSSAPASPAPAPPAPVN